MRTFRNFRIAVATFAASLAVFVAPAPAQADLFGGDVVELAAILAESIAQGATLAEQLTQLTDQVSLVRTTLAQLDPATYAAVLQVINNTYLDYNRLTSDVNSIGYTLESVNRDFQRAFPTDFSSTPMSQVDSLYGKWQDDIWSSTIVAARAQSVLSTLRDNANQAAAILSSSQSAQGTVGQLQAVVQMLGLMQSQTNSLIQSLATTGRVLTTQASTGASERQLSREKKKRNLAGYTRRGSPVTVHSKLP